MTPAPKHRNALGRGLGDLIRPTAEPDAGASGQPGGTHEPGTHEPGTQEDGRTHDPGSPQQTAAVPAPEGSYFADLPVDSIVPNPRQPRQVFDEDELAELVESIREVGLLQPVVVRPVGDGFELVMGERRLRAVRVAGLDRIPAIVRRTEDHALLRDALLENLHRAQLNPLEEAAAYQQMLDDFGCTQEELAGRIKRSRPQISNTIRLLRLPAPVQRRVAAGVLSAGHARALLGLEDPMAQEKLAQRIVAEGLSVRATEEIVSMGERTARAPRTPTTRTLSPRAVELSQVLSDSFETRVSVAIGRRKGRITIEFAGEDDLGRVMGVLRSGVPTSIH